MVRFLITVNSMEEEISGLNEYSLGARTVDGFKSPEQVGLDLAKTAATAVISMGCSAAGSAVGKVADAS